MKNFILFLLLCPKVFSQNYYTPREIFDFSVGDTLEYYISGGTAFTQYQQYGMTRYCIHTKTFNIDSSEVCYYSNTYSVQRNFNSSTGYYDTTRWSGNATWCYTHLDSSLRYLPEYNDASISDTVELSLLLSQYCTPPSPIYYQDTIEDFYALGQTAPTQFFTMSENCLSYINEKEGFRVGFGKIKSYNSYETSSYVVYNDTTLCYMVKNGVSYGLQDPFLSLQVISGPIIRIVTNPVTSILSVYGYEGPVSIKDLSGRTIYSVNSIEGGIMVDFLETGNYYLQLTTMDKILKFVKY